MIVRQVGSERRPVLLQGPLRDSNTLGCQIEVLIVQENLHRTARGFPRASDHPRDILVAGTRSDENGAAFPYTLAVSQLYETADRSAVDVEHGQGAYFLGHFSYSRSGLLKNSHRDDRLFLYSRQYGVPVEPQERGAFESHDGRGPPAVRDKSQLPEVAAGRQDLQNGFLPLLAK